MSYSDQQELLFGDMDVEVELGKGQGAMGKVHLVRSRSTGERFAVKRTRFSKWAGQRNFLLELMTWYGLPRHPNIVECRFFRSLPHSDSEESEIAIFAEYVPGGELANGERHGSSLADWIEAGKLTRLDQILDVAIQFAWGLQAAHELGVVHQDVKPLNVLLHSTPLFEDGEVTEDIHAKVADFGLARARAMASQPGPRSNAGNTFTCSNFTPAYCSPEQEAFERVTSKTDIWSWGISILDIFRGEPNPGLGSLAPEVLETYLQSVPDNPLLPRMPSGVVQILRKCFRKDPAERWGSMGAVAEAMRAVFRKELETEYPRIVQPDPDRNDQKCTDHDRWTRFGVQWEDPREWLISALQAESRDLGEVETLLAHTTSRRGLPIADLIGCEEACRILGPLVASGDRGMAVTLVKLCAMKAVIHIQVDDVVGAIAVYDRAIAVCEREVQDSVRHELFEFLAGTYDGKATALYQLGKVSTALQLFDKAIALKERLVKDDKRNDLTESLVMSYSNKAAAMTALGDARGAVVVLDRALVLLFVYERLVPQDQQQHDLATRRSAAYHEKGRALASLGEFRAALADYEHAIDGYSRMLKEGRREAASPLAISYMNKATALRFAGKPDRAVVGYDCAITLFEQLVQHANRYELRDLLAGAYQNKALSLADLGDSSAAVGFYDRGILLYERLVKEEARDDLANNLAEAYQNKASSLRQLGDLNSAVALYDIAISIRERLVHQQEQQQFVKDLAMSYQNKGAVVYCLGDLSAAVALFDRALIVYERLDHEAGGQEVAKVLAQIYYNKALALAGLPTPGDALPLFDESISIRERLLKWGRSDVVGELAQSLVQKGAVLYKLGKLCDAIEPCDRASAIYLQYELGQEIGRPLAKLFENVATALYNDTELLLALSLYNRAINVYERLVDVDGCQELNYVLAGMYQNKGTALAMLGNLPGGVAMLDKAILCWELHCDQTDALGDIARARIYRAHILLDLGDRQRASSDAKEAVSTLERVVQSTDNRNSPVSPREAAKLHNTLEWAKEHLREILLSQRLERTGPIGVRSRPDRDADPFGAMRLNDQYQEAMRQWRSLPFWKRWFQSRPIRPTGI